MNLPQESKNKAQSCLKTAERILFITYPLVKDKKLLLKALEQINGSLNLIPNYQGQKSLTLQDQETLKNLASAAEKHQKSSMEFLRNEKVVIMSETPEIAIIEPENLKKALFLARRLLEDS